MTVTFTLYSLVSLALGEVSYNIMRTFKQQHGEVYTIRN